MKYIFNYIKKSIIRIFIADARRGRDRIYVAERLSYGPQSMYCLGVHAVYKKCAYICIGRRARIRFDLSSQRVIRPTALE